MPGEKITAGRVHQERSQVTSNECLGYMAANTDLMRYHQPSLCKATALLCDIHLRYSS